jgi:hypothetical protein
MVDAARRSRPAVNSADDRLLDALRALAATLDDLAVPGMVIGGIAVIAHGVPRQTVDVDATVWGEHLDLRRLFDALAAHQIVPRIDDAEAFARERQVLLLRHQPSGTPLEVSLASLPFEWDALQRSTIVDFGGAKVRVATAEDLVIYKAVAWRDRDRSDVERLLLLHGSTIDIARVRTLVQQFAEALDEPERVADFERIVSRAMGRP